MKRVRVWLQRAGYTRGFGVQSPWAYQLIRYVINEHYPYYAYEELERTYPHVEERNRRLALLYFRLANYCQANAWGIRTEQENLKMAYIQAGCKSTNILSLGQDGRIGRQQFHVLLISLKEDGENILPLFLRQADTSSLLIIEDIHFSKHTLRAWRKIQENPLTGISFDLYDCGLVFFNRGMFKQSYKVNF